MEIGQTNDGYLKKFMLKIRNDLILKQKVEGCQSVLTQIMTSIFKEHSVCD